MSPENANQLKVRERVIERGAVKSSRTHGSPRLPRTPWRCSGKTSQAFLREPLDFKSVLNLFSISDHVHACVVFALLIRQRVHRLLTDCRPYDNSTCLMRRMPSEFFSRHNFGECFPTVLEARMLKCCAETDDLSECFHQATSLKLGVYQARQAFSIDSHQEQVSNHLPF